MSSINFINHLIVHIEGVVSVVHDGIINIKLVDVLLTGMCVARGTVDTVLIKMTSEMADNRAYSSGNRMSVRT